MKMKANWLVALVVGFGVGLLLFFFRGGSEAPTQGIPVQFEYRDGFQEVEGWPTEADRIGAAAAVEVTPHGNVLVFRRESPNLWEVDKEGGLVREWGDQIAQWAHSVRVDREGYLWTVDGQGHEIKKWSADGRELLLSLGEFGVSGDGPYHFNRPTDVAVATNGDIFVSDGYGNSRIVRYDREGRFIMEWGRSGSGTREFDIPHSITIDSRGRILVADRENDRVQVFDVKGTLLDSLTHVGRPYGVYVTEEDLLYVADLPGATVWIVDLDSGEIVGNVEGTDGIHWVAVDPLGNVYTASVRYTYAKKYVPQAQVRKSH